MGGGARGAIEPMPEPTMSNRNHCMWIKHFVEEMDMDSDNEHDGWDYLSDDEEEYGKRLTKLKFHLVEHFKVHPKLL